MISSGIYQLLVCLNRGRRLTVGGLGHRMFNKGWYIYTGSAQKNFFHRLLRHHRKDKKYHWHIDYLLGIGEIVAYDYLPYRDGLECDTHQHTLAEFSGGIEITGFGCSDCRCSSHLIYISMSINDNITSGYNKLT